MAFSAVYPIFFVFYISFVFFDIVPILKIYRGFLFSLYEVSHVQEIPLTGFLRNIFLYPIHPKNMFVGAPYLVRPFLFVRG